MGDHGADLPEQQRGDGEGSSVEDECGAGAERAGDQPTQCPADRQRDRPGDASEDVGGHQIIAPHQAGDERRPPRLEHRGEAELQHGEQVDQPQAVCTVHQQEAEDDEYPGDIGEDEQAAAVEVIEQHAGQRAEQQRRQEARQQQQADGQPGAVAVFGDQYAEDDGVEPVPDQADDLRGPQTSIIRIALQQAEVLHASPDWAAWWPRFWSALRLPGEVHVGDVGTGRDIGEC